MLCSGFFLHDDRIRFTNSHWNFTVAELSQRFAFSNFKVINDFAAVAYAVPYLSTEDRLNLQSPQPIVFDDPKHDQYAVLGAGTGLGISGIKRHRGKFIDIATEGGHCSFAPLNDLEQELLNVLKKQFSRVSNERLLSGPGLLSIYRAVAEIYGQEPINTSSAGIICQGALDGVDELRVKSFELFCNIFGSVAGDVALMLGATGGVLLAGGIAPKYTDFLIASDFRKRFEDKGRYRNYMEQIPSEIIIRDNPGLMGAAICLAAEG